MPDSCEARHPRTVPEKSGKISAEIEQLYRMWYELRRGLSQFELGWPKEDPFRQFNRDYTIEDSGSRHIRY